MKAVAAWILALALEGCGLDAGLYRQFTPQPKPGLWERSCDETVGLEAGREHALGDRSDSVSTLRQPNRVGPLV